MLVFSTSYLSGVIMKNGLALKGAFQFVNRLQKSSVTIDDTTSPSELARQLGLANYFDGIFRSEYSCNRIISGQEIERKLILQLETRPELHKHVCITLIFREPERQFQLRIEYFRRGQGQIVSRSGDQTLIPAFTDPKNVRPINIWLRTQRRKKVAASLVTSKAVGSCFEQWLASVTHILVNCWPHRRTA